MEISESKEITLTELLPEDIELIREVRVKFHLIEDRCLAK